MTDIARIHVSRSIREWRKSTRSTLSNCVEVARVGMIAVRDSKDPNGPILVYTVDEWRAFVGGIKAGEFDDLLDAEVA